MNIRVTSGKTNVSVSKKGVRVGAKICGVYLSTMLFSVKPSKKK